MNKYIYEGPVMIFDRFVTKDWSGETIAVTEKKARSNLIYQYKKQNNLVPSSRVKLTGKLIKQDWEENMDGQIYTKLKFE